VENEDFASMLCRFEAGATGTFEASRTVVGPESQNAFEVYGTKGSLSWNHERINELQYYAVTDSPDSGYTTVFGGERFPFHGAFVPGQANSIGFDDLITIQDFAFLGAPVQEGPDAIDEALTFGLVVGEAPDRRRRTRRSGRLQRAPRTRRDQPVGELEDLGAGAIVLDE